MKKDTHPLRIGVGEPAARVDDAFLDPFPVDAPLAVHEEEGAEGKAVHRGVQRAELLR